MNKKILLAALMGTFVVSASAAEGEAGQQTLVVTHQAVDLQGPASLLGMQLGPRLGAFSKPVKNAPYSAEVVSERLQNLSDGNQIVNKTTSLSYRDSLGRIRQEVRDAKGEVLTVTINDPVEASTYVLSPRTRTATRIAVNKEIGKEAADAARARLDQLRKEGKLPAGERREIIIRRFQGAEGDTKSHGAEGAVHIESLGALPNGRDLAARLAPLTGALGDMKWARSATTKDLGSREIEGVKAEGKLRSYEIPAGEVGNRNAIVVSDESWYSPDLQVTLLSKHTDPRAGETSYRLSGLKREEPAAALFAVPSDYTVKEAMTNVARVIEKKAP